MKNQLLCLLFLLLGSITVVAQQRVTGNVTGSDGVPLIGVTVAEKGTTNGAVTDFDGNYEITVPTGATLTFSYTGYGTQETIVGNESAINMTLQTGVALDEVVVTALGIERDKKALSYSVTEVGGENASQARAMNVIQSLSGKVAGVNVASTATGAGGSTRVVIRGNSSISGSNQPLYVVDGVPIDNTNLGSAGMWGGQDWGDGISSLNPDDIESYTVLKGNSAAALYGFRASNGVIIITTKSGKKSKGIGVEINSQIRAENINNLLDFQDQYGHGNRGAAPTTQQEAQEFGLSSWGGRLDGSSVPQFDGVSRPYSAVGDNVNRFYRTGTTYSNTLALTGGDENYNFRFSGAALNNEDIVPNSGIDRYNFSLKANAQFSEKFSGTIGVNYINENSQNRPRLSDSPGNANYTALSLPPSININDMKGDLDKLGAAEDGTELQFNDNVFVTNPWWAAHQFVGDAVKNRVIGNIQLRYELFDGFYTRGRIGLDQYGSRRTSTTPYGTAYSPFGQIDERNIRFTELNTELVVGYDKDLTDNIGLNIFVGGNQLRNKRETLGASGNNFSIPFFEYIGNAANQNVTYGYDEFQNNSLFASAEIALNRAIYLTGTARNDWFSTLTDVNEITDNDELYYSAGISAVLSDLVDMPKAITFAKLRASYAEVGGVGAAQDPYLLSLAYQIEGQGHNGQPLGRISNNRIPNANLTPLTSGEFEVGLDVRLFDNRLGIDVGYYNRQTKNDILNARVSPTAGYNEKTVNIGRMENKGVELLVTGTPVRTKDFSWDVSVNFANNQNTVLSLLTEEDDGESVRVEESRTRNAYIEHIEGLPYSQIVGFEYARDASGNFVLDDNGVPTRSDATVPLGTGVHPTSIGINNSIRFKDVSLSFLFDAKSGGYLYAATNAYAYTRGLHQNTLEGRESGIGDVAAADVQDYYGGIAFNVTEQFVEKADFIKLRELVLTYRLPKSLLGNLPIQGINLGIAGRNLWLVSSMIDNVDPESTYTVGNGQGLEMFGVPQTRSIQFNLGIRF
ncbi:MAG: SusC/RagA family TonB-linked outer membrane protein [Saprospiraceae bacterium]